MSEWSTELEDLSVTYLWFLKRRVQLLRESWEALHKVAPGSDPDRLFDDYALKFSLIKYVRQLRKRKYLKSLHPHDCKSHNKRRKRYGNTDRMVKVYGNMTREEFMQKMEADMKTDEDRLNWALAMRGI